MRFGWSHPGWRRFWEFILLPSGKSNGGQRQPQQQQQQQQPQQQPLCPLWAFLTPRCWCFDCVQIFWFSRQRAMSHGLRSFRVESLGIEPFPSHLWRQLTESSNFTLCGQTDHVFWFSCVIFSLEVDFLQLCLAWAWSFLPTVRLGSLSRAARPTPATWPPVASDEAAYTDIE